MAVQNEVLFQKIVTENYLEPHMKVARIWFNFIWRSDSMWFELFMKVSPQEMVIGLKTKKTKKTTEKYYQSKKKKKTTFILVVSNVLISDVSLISFHRHLQHCVHVYKSLAKLSSQLDC